MNPVKRLFYWIRSFIVRPKWLPSRSCHNCGRLLVVDERSGMCSWCGYIEKPAA